MGPSSNWVLFENTPLEKFLDHLHLHFTEVNSFIDGVFAGQTSLDLELSFWVVLNLCQQWHLSLASVCTTHT